MYSQIEIDSQFDGKLQLIYLNQPDSYNSLTQIMLEELRNAVHKFSEDENVRCVAIAGKGKAFCAGQNLKEALSFNEEDRTIQRFVIEYYNPLVLEIVKCKKPVIALVNGPAVGAGAMLASICDFTLATESSYFSFAFANIGLIPDTAGTYYLPKLVGRQLASYLSFTGKKVPALEAKKIGLVADVFSDSDFVEKSMEVLTQLSHAATTALYLTKKAFNKSYDFTLREQLDYESIIQQDAAETEDFKEGVTAFIEKRLPNYKGK
jgi:2-(1,2-epoxy-1,2-dihydrophenyl)acetyl-CoA isomerase